MSAAPQDPRQTDATPTPDANGLVLDYHKNRTKSDRVTAFEFRIVGAVIGFFFGAALAFFGLLAAGAGHGTYVLLGVISSPLALTDLILVALFGTQSSGPHSEP
jgi:hypothetical protein